MVTPGRGAGEVAASVAVGPVGGLVQGEGDVDDARREREDPRVVGQELEFGQGFADGGARFERGASRDTHVSNAWPKRLLVVKIE
ncbi:hypothetical protein [Streptomyces antimycoticus]